jgi:hypothetical protein
VPLLADKLPETGVNTFTNNYLHQSIDLRLYRLYKRMMVKIGEKLSFIDDIGHVKR